MSTIKIPEHELAHLYFGVRKLFFPLFEFGREKFVENCESLLESCVKYSSRFFLRIRQACFGLQNFVW